MMAEPRTELVVVVTEAAAGASAAAMRHHAAAAPTAAAATPAASTTIAPSTTSVSGLCSISPATGTTAKNPTLARSIAHYRLASRRLTSTADTNDYHLDLSSSAPRPTVAAHES
jgi:hypothetical protein